MVGCGFLFKEVQALVDHCVAKATVQQCEAYLASMPQHCATAHRGCAFQSQLSLTGHIAIPI